eukprot:CAMPEP_0203983202 /NCGR_PEP_ID=MMETSP0360-20130528/3638_1 /ASSEMBLY_ACC=CAM_ASM_000342 /TAXON_ID=268821 /ORGANISM="Scrippsiella Hangoei, Strain SHTV-5" /LENGTH=48 /DNA_ID= /DNA_START= /DNA_END= /DNA_ORIENTATION=
MALRAVTRDDAEARGSPGGDQTCLGQLRRRAQQDRLTGRPSAMRSSGM